MERKMRSELSRGTTRMQLPQVRRKHMTFWRKEIPFSEQEM
jgi:hypothetical protein